jgi:hypothetical protein
MGALGSLSKSATLVFWYISIGSTFAFGTLFLVAWFSEEFAKSEKWKARRNLLIVLAIIGVAGEQIATLAEFVFSEHLQTIDDSEIAGLTARVSGTFTPEQMSLLQACLQKAPKGVVWVAAKAFDDRSSEYASRVRKIFADARFDARDQPPNTQALLSLGATGLALFVRDSNAAPPHAVPILDCFNNKAIIKLSVGHFTDVLNWVGANDVLIGVSAP